jgi:hypothetical protein
MASIIVSTSAGMLLACLGANAFASPILLDHSPAALDGAVANNAYRNMALSQHFAEDVRFGADTLVNGMDIYSAAAYAALGTPVAITVWADKAGLPGTVLGQFTAALSAIDGDGATAGNVRKHADFAGFTMLADTVYWIGMAGKTIELAQTAMTGTGGDGQMAQFTGAGNYQGQSIAGDMAFRLYGTETREAAIELAEPGSLPLAGVAGIALLAAQLGRQRRRARLP